MLINDVSWEMNFTIMAAFMGVGVVMASLVQEPKQYGPPPKSLAEATVVPFRSYSSAERWATLAMLAFLALYKLGDNMATALASPFYLDMQFTTDQIWDNCKYAALVPSIIGGL
ncbi:MAG: hypothetical protein CM15mP68_2070 [Pseudomonadota bacterium]|nr:MAG: hypothetical protein CM15mP68_2070 [Pseudomonadota bacterium]